MYYTTNRQLLEQKRTLIHSGVLSANNENDCINHLQLRAITYFSSVWFIDLT